MPASFLAQMLAKQLPGPGVKQTYLQPVPLHLTPPPNPAGWRPVVGSLDFHATIQMHGAFAVLITAERFQGQRQQVWFLLGKHGGHLSFSSAVDARIGPARLPMVQVSLRLLETLKPLSFERCFLGMTDAGFNLTFAIWISHSAGHGYHAVVGQQITIERVERGIVNVRSEHALAQIVEHYNAHAATQSAKRFLVELGPDA